MWHMLLNSKHAFYDDYSISYILVCLMITLQLFYIRVLSFIALSFKLDLSSLKASKNQWNFFIFQPRSHSWWSYLSFCIIKFFAFSNLLDCSMHEISGSQILPYTFKLLLDLSVTLANRSWAAFRAQLSVFIYRRPKNCDYC